MSVMCKKINWPSNLVEEIAYRRCVIFIGSGISASAINEAGKQPPTWGKFISDIKKLIKSPDEDDNKFIDDMIAQEDYLMALQVIYDLSDSGAYNKYLKDTYSRGGYIPSETHKVIKQLDSKIVITTNFDKIYDNLCNQDTYIVHNYRDTKSIISNIKSPESIIIKAHGTIDDTNNIIFTGKQYYKAQENHPDFYSLLNALFLTNTVIFLGYSLSDPDINLVLQNVKNTSNSSAPHYVVLKDGTSKHRLKQWKDTYNIEALEYGPSHDKLEDNLIELKELVEELREKRSIG